MRKKLKLLDIIFIICFGATVMMLTNQFIGNSYIAVAIGIAGIIYSFIAIKEEYEE